LWRRAFDLTDYEAGKPTPKRLATGYVESAGQLGRRSRHAATVLGPSRVSSRLTDEWLADIRPISLATRGYAQAIAIAEVELTKGKDRLAAFSDGVIAIITTIMVLDLKLPCGGDWHLLAEAGPNFFSYVLNFVYVAI
jgi:hypothetical protein